jgi:hypothetical protein
LTAAGDFAVYAGEEVLTVATYAEALAGSVASTLEEIPGAASNWVPTSILRNGWNIETDVTASEFQTNLEANGFKVMQSGTSGNGPFTVLSNGQLDYTIYNATSGGPSVQIYNPAYSQIIAKIRLGGW